MTPEERAAGVAADKRAIAQFIDLAPQMTREQLHAAVWTLCGIIAGRAIVGERERCAQVAEDTFNEERLFEGVRNGDSILGAAIRATGTSADYRNAMASASAHFAGEPVPPGVPTVADALALGSAVLRDIATGTNAASRDDTAGPWCDGLWLYRHTDGKAYVCRASNKGSELAWFDTLPQGDWGDAGWVLLEATGTNAAGGDNE